MKPIKLFTVTVLDLFSVCLTCGYLQFPVGIYSHFNSYMISCMKFFQLFNQCMSKE